MNTQQQSEIIIQSIKADAVCVCASVLHVQSIVTVPRLIHIIFNTDRCVYTIV